MEKESDLFASKVLELASRLALLGKGYESDLSGTFQARIEILDILLTSQSLLL